MNTVQLNAGPKPYRVKDCGYQNVHVNATNFIPLWFHKLKYAHKDEDNSEKNPS